MKPKIELCFECKHAMAGVKHNQAFYHCKCESNWLWFASGKKPTTTQNETFEVPSNCPYILEHALEQS